MSSIKSGQLLKIGDVVRLSTGGTATVESLIGSGGQGEVYRVSVNGAPMALKWYFPHLKTAPMVESLERLINLHDPDPRFLWPVAIATSDQAAAFGYVMPLRDASFTTLLHVYSRKVDVSFRILCTVAYELCDAFHHLHGRGLCYRDISFGNVFFNKDTGAILICDNDNVCADDPKIPVQVTGTPSFMAPEIVEGDSKPNTQTDLWSLAVLLFYIFCLHNPFNGKKETAIKCLDLPARRRLYGYQATFIFHPTDRSNEPDPQHHSTPQVYWPIYPAFFQDLFIATFTDGVLEPGKRVRESAWKKGLIRLRDSIILGPRGAENFFDEGKLQTAGAIYDWQTKSPCVIPPRLIVNKNSIMLAEDTVVFAHHVDPDAEGNFADLIAKGTHVPDRKDVPALRNVGSIAWVCSAPNGETREVAPGRGVRLEHDLRINFGACEGTVEMVKARD